MPSLGGVYTLNFLTAFLSLQYMGIWGNVWGFYSNKYLLRRFLARFWGSNYIPPHFSVFGSWPGERVFSHFPVVILESLVPNRWPTKRQAMAFCRFKLIHKSSHNGPGPGQGRSLDDMGSSFWGKQKYREVRVVAKFFLPEIHQEFTLPVDTSIRRVLMMYSINSIV